MKKAFVVMFCLLLSTAIQAQLIKSFGIKTGGTASYQKWEYSPSLPVSSFDADTKNGFNIGAFVEFFNMPVFSLVTEVNYVEKGYQMDVYRTTIEHPDGIGDKETVKFGINYLNFSLLGKARLDGIICTPYIIAGPRLDVELSKSDGMNDDFYNSFRKTRLGFKAGAGTEIKLFGINFLAEVLYDAELWKLYESNSLKIATSSVDFRGGFSINL